MKIPQYMQLFEVLKSQIRSGIYKDGDLLPSENDLARVHNLNRATVRQALSELVKVNYIKKIRGKGSLVNLNSGSLAILSVKGFSEVVESKSLQVNTDILEGPLVMAWPENFFYHLHPEEKQLGCIYLSRIRKVNTDPVMLENTYVTNLNLSRFCTQKLINDSLFQTLMIRYSLEINEVKQDLRAISSDQYSSQKLNLVPGAPALHIYLKFSTNIDHLNIYSSIISNTDKYSIANSL